MEQDRKSRDKPTHIWSPYCLFSLNQRIHSSVLRNRPSHSTNFSQDDLYIKTFCSDMPRSYLGSQRPGLALDSIISWWCDLGMLFMSMKIINKQSITVIEKSFIWAKLGTIVWKTASQITLRNCSRKAWFSAQFYVLSEQRTSNQSGIHFFKISKTRSASTQRVSMALAPGKGVLSSKEDQHWHPRKGGIWSLFLTWAFFTSGQGALFFNN